MKLLVTTTGNEHENRGVWVGTFSKNLARLDFRDSLDLLQESARGIGNRLDRVVATIDDQLDIALRDTVDPLQEHGHVKRCSQGAAGRTYLQSGERGWRARLGISTIVGIFGLMELAVVRHGVWTFGCVEMDSKAAQRACLESVARPRSEWVIGFVLCLPWQIAL